MRLPKIYKRDGSTDPSIKKTILEVEKLPVIDYTPDVDFDDNKSVERYVRTIKSVIRTSIEYKSLIRFLKDKLEINHCFFMPKVKRERDSKVIIELHHTCFTLENYVVAVLRKRYAEGETYDVQSVCKEVMYQHYLGNVSLTALSSTAHSLIHEDDSGLFIPLHMTDFGNINAFVEEYKQWIPKDELQKYGQYQILSDAIKNIDEILPDYLDRNFVFYKCEGVEFPSMDKVLELIDLGE